MNTPTDRQLLTGCQAREYREFLHLDIGAMALQIGTTHTYILKWESASDEDRIPALYSRRIIHAVAVEEAKNHNSEVERNIVQLLPMEDEICSSVDMHLWREFFQLNQQEFARSLGLTTTTVRKWNLHINRNQPLVDEIVSRLRWFVLVRESRIYDITIHYQHIYSDIFQGKDVRNFRNTFWLTQQDLARTLKISPASIRLWESPSRRNKNIASKYLKIFRLLLENVLDGVDQDTLISHSPKDLIFATADAIWQRQDMSKLASNKEKGGTGDSMVRDLPPNSTANYIVESTETWIRNIHRIGKVRLEDLTKLQADLEYMKGFIEERSGSS